MRALPVKLSAAQALLRRHLRRCHRAAGCGFEASVAAAAPRCRRIELEAELQGTCDLPQLLTDAGRVNEDGCVGMIGKSAVAGHDDPLLPLSDREQLGIGDVRYEEGVTAQETEPGREGSEHGIAGGANNHR